MSKTIPKPKKGRRGVRGWTCFPVLQLKMTGRYGSLKQVTMLAGISATLPGLLMETINNNIKSFHLSKSQRTWEVISI